MRRDQQQIATPVPESKYREMQFLSGKNDSKRCGQGEWDLLRAVRKTVLGTRGKAQYWYYCTDGREREQSPSLAAKVE